LAPWSRDLSAVASICPTRSISEQAIAYKLKQALGLKKARSCCLNIAHNEQAECAEQVSDASVYVSVRDNGKKSQGQGRPRSKLNETTLPICICRFDGCCSAGNGWSSNSYFDGQC
jgi:hypothetical protein